MWIWVMPNAGQDPLVVQGPLVLEDQDLLGSLPLRCTKPEKSKHQRHITQHIPTPKIDQPLRAQEHRMETDNLAELRDPRHSDTSKHL